MDWKAYYAGELRTPDARKRMTSWLKRARREGPPGGVPSKTVLSFPHTTLDAAGPLQAVVAEAICRCGCRRVITLGVLHTSALPAASVAADPARPGSERERAFAELAGGFLGAADGLVTPFGTLPPASAAPAPSAFLRSDDDVLRNEFSLDTFHAVLRWSATLQQSEPPHVLPVYIGLTRHPVSGSYAVADALGAWLRKQWDDETAIVATGDLVHYGAVYGSPALSVAPPELETWSLERLKEVLRLGLEQRDDEAAYEIAWQELRSDQREMLPVLARMLDGGARADILAYELTDYADILRVPPPCRVASALVAYTRDAEDIGASGVRQGFRDEENRNRGHMNAARQSSPKKTVGILGGMGPAATIEFFRRLVAATPAAIDQAHLHILIDNNPHVPDRSAAIFGQGEDPGPALADMARRLESCGADFLTLPCNTGHAFHRAIRDAVSIPFIDMIEETVRTLHVTRVGLLSTTGTIHTGLYASACERHGVSLVVPNASDQELVMDIIRRIKAGGSGTSVREHAARVVASLEAQGAEAVIAGCTEISLIPGDNMPLPWIDALDCLVEASVRRALNASSDIESEDTQ